MYQIVSDRRLCVLERSVRLLMKAGWRTTGGLFKDGIVYMQAMVKKP